MIRTLVSVVALLALAGCTDAPSTDETTPTPDQAEAETPQAGTTAAEGPQISGTGYSYHVPRGWGPMPSEIPGFDPDSVAFDLEDDDGFADNVNVVLAPGGTMTPDEAESAAQNELTSFGAENVTVNDRRTVAGEEAAHTTADFSMNDNEYTVEQFYPTSGDQTFVVTFSFSTSVTPPERAEVTEAVLATWTWED